MKELLVLLLAASVCSINAFEREKLINAAIHDVEREELSTAAQDNKALDGLTTSSEVLNHGFKRGSPLAIKQGKARLKFEKLLHKAERSILESERKEMIDTNNLAKAEEIAKVLMSKPGSILTKDEVAKMYEHATCEPQNKANCNLPAMKTMRSVTGVCNNLKEPLLGSSTTAFRRLIDPQYEDGFSQLRGTMQSEGTLFVGGPFLPPNPSPRIISINVIQDQPLVSHDKTHLLMQWGQFMDHDLSLAPPIRSDDEDQPLCKECERTDECAPILVAARDPIFGNDACIEFTRSIPACDLGPANGEVRSRQQMNDLTSFIDASQVYGSRQVVFDAVRDSTTGLLRTGPNIPENGGVSLPIVNSPTDLVECTTPNCFLAGDMRVNEQTALTIMHTIWLREHNRIVFEILQSNPGTHPDVLFQTARSIVGAEIQKITFKDYLPLLLGSAMSVIKRYTGYKSSVDPTIPNAFAAAAFRFGHSQINPVFDRLDENNIPLSIGPLKLLDTFFNPSQYTISGGTDPILRGLLQKPARSVDEFVNDILTNHLFQTNVSVGVDLAALNIQRGRDHGLPPYYTWKRWAEKECNLSSQFKNDLTEIRLLQTYGTLETVDLWVGGLAEEHVSGGLLGATFACIFAKTFEALRDGDRFYYENLESALFSADQRKTLEDASLSRIICDNSDNINNIQENAFQADEPSISCSRIKRVDLDMWNNDEIQCYLRAQVNRRMGKIDLESTSFLKRQKKNTKKNYMSTLIREENTTCIRIVCPTENNVAKVSVFIDKSQRCMAQAQSSTLLKTNKKSFWGIISLEEIENSANGAYKSLHDCEYGTRYEAIFNCYSDAAAAESNEELLQELETSLTQTASSQTASFKSSPSIEIPWDEATLPDEVKEFMKDEPAENVSEQSAFWKEEAINTLENLLTTLKHEKKDEQINNEQNDEATDQELYKNLDKLLKDSK